MLTKDSDLDSLRVSRLFVKAMLFWPLAKNRFENCVDLIAAAMA